MKKILFILLPLIMVLIAWFCLTKQMQPTPEPTNAIPVPQAPEPETNLVEISSNPAPVQIAPQPTNEIESTASLKNALMATNIEQWKTAIKGLHKSPGLSESWDLEQTNRTMSVPVLLAENGQTVSYKANFIDISIKNEIGDIREVEMHSPNMNIDETRELGLQICSMFELDSTDFIAWCDKVGNHWLDAPLYGSRDIHDPNSNKIFVFQTLRTYNDERPWLINFMIIPNP